MLTVASWGIVVVWLIWFVVYWGGEKKVMADVNDTVTKGENSKLDQILVMLLTVSILPMFATALLATVGWVSFTQSVPLALLGLVVGAVGLAGAFYARHFLGKQWTAVTAVQKDHQIIDKGPYGLVRHPIYTTTLGIYLGTLLVFPGWWTLFLFVALVIEYSLKAWDEEKFLRAQLGHAYTDYSKRVAYRLLPFIW